MQVVPAVHVRQVGSQVPEQVPPEQKKPDKQSVELPQVLLPPSIVLNEEFATDFAKS